MENNKKNNEDDNMNDFRTEYMSIFAIMENEETDDNTKKNPIVFIVKFIKKKRVDDFQTSFQANEKTFSQTNEYESNIEKMEEKNC